MSDISVFTCTITEDISFLLGPRSSFASSITFLSSASTVGFTIYTGRDYLSPEVMTSPPSIPAGVCPGTSMLRQLKNLDSVGGSDERCSFGTGFQEMLPNVPSVLTSVTLNVVNIANVTNCLGITFCSIAGISPYARPYFPRSMFNRSFSTVVCWAIFCCSSYVLAPISFIRRNPFEAVILTTSFCPSSLAFYLGGLKETLVSDASRGMLCRSCTMRTSRAMVLHAQSATVTGRAVCTACVEGGAGAFAV